MKKHERTYTIQQLADLAKVSVRTLHHYDEIGLLKPAKRSDARYRLYTDVELMLLQQILFYRELQFPLRQISEIISKPDFDLVNALLHHHTMLAKKVQRYSVLLSTIEHTIRLIEEATMPLKPEELYEGFSQEQIHQMESYVDEHYDPQLVAESRRNTSTFTKERLAEIKAEHEWIAHAIAQVMPLGPTSEEVQVLIARHHRWIENFYRCSAAVYEGLADLYVSSEDFARNYNNHAVGLAEFMAIAMKYYARTSLAE